MKNYQTYFQIMKNKVSVLKNYKTTFKNSFKEDQKIE